MNYQCVISAKLVELQPEQTLDLWCGIITSHYRLGGVPVTVITSSDSQTDTLAVRLESALVASGKLGMRTGEGFRKWTPQSAEAVRERLLPNADALLWLRTCEAFGATVTNSGTFDRFAFNFNEPILDGAFTAADAFLLDAKAPAGAKREGGFGRTGRERVLERGGPGHVQRCQAGEDGVLG